MQLLPSMIADKLSAFSGGAGGGGAAPNAPILYIVGSLTTFNPEFNLVADFAAGDTVQIEYQVTGGGWSSPVVSFHTVISDEIAGLQFVYNISPDLTTGNYDFRMKFKHSGGSYSNYSNILVIAIPLPSPIISFRGQTDNDGSGGTYTKSVDIGTASADRLIVVGFISHGNDDGGSNKIDGIAVNGVALTKVFSNETDRHKSWWKGIVASGSGAQNVVITYTGWPGQPKLFGLWALTGWNSSTHKAAAGNGSNTIASVAADAGDAVLAVNSCGNATFSMNPLSSETFTTRRDDNGGGFTNYGSLAQFGELIAANTATFNLKIENPASPGNAASAAKMVITFR